MSTQYNIHPDFKALSAIHPPLNDKSITKIQKFMWLLYHQQRSGSAVKVERVNYLCLKARASRFAGNNLTLVQI